MSVVEVEYTEYGSSVRRALDRVRDAQGRTLASILAAQQRVLLKPNLVNAAPPPVTTPAAFVGAVARYVRTHSDAELVIAEGCGDAQRTTAELFTLHGYDALASEIGASLLDLNEARLRTEQRPGCTLYPQMPLPEVLFSHFVVSLPVLKAHSLAGVTGALKNMMGALPPRHFGGRGGAWRKASFHGRLQRSLIELAAYAAPDLSVVDASVGLAEYHLGGPECDPPLNRILAGLDPWAVDRRGCGLLGRDWRDVGHIAAGVLTDGT